MVRERLFVFKLSGAKGQYIAIVKGILLTLRMASELSFHSSPPTYWNIHFHFFSFRTPKEIPEGYSYGYVLVSNSWPRGTNLVSNTFWHGKRFVADTSTTGMLWKYDGIKINKPTCLSRTQQEIISLQRAQLSSFRIAHFTQLHSPLSPSYWFTFICAGYITNAMGNGLVNIQTMPGKLYIGQLKDVRKDLEGERRAIIAVLSTWLEDFSCLCSFFEKNWFCLSLSKLCSSAAWQ